MLVICNLHDVHRAIIQYRPTAILSMLDPGHCVRWIYIPTLEHLILRFHDVSDERQGYTTPKLYHIELINAFITRPGKILVHCHAGCSRTGAAVYMYLCLKHTVKPAVELLPKHLRPNRLMVELADKHLNLAGFMAKKRPTQATEPYPGPMEIK